MGSLLNSYVGVVGRERVPTTLPVVLATDGSPASIAAGGVGSVRIQIGEGEHYELYGLTGFCASGSSPGALTNELNLKLQVYDETANTQWFSRAVWIGMILPTSAMGASTTDPASTTPIYSLFKFPKPIVVRGSYTWRFEVTNKTAATTITVYQFALHGYQLSVR